MEYVIEWILFCKGGRASLVREGSDMGRRKNAGESRKFSFGFEFEGERVGD